MDNNALQQIKDIIARSNRVVITLPANPSVDQMAGALSLKLTLGSQGKNIVVISPTQALVEHSSLVGIDQVTTTLEGSGGDLVVSFPYRDGEIDKVSYTIDDGFLNIVVKSGEKGLTFSESDVQFKRGADKPDMVISVGNTTLAQISESISEEVLNSVTLLNIDNNRDNEGYGNVVLVSPRFSSISEQIADLLLNLGTDLDIDVAQNLLLGLTDATNNFQDAKTSYLAFEIASILIKKGAVRPGKREDQQQSRQSQPKVDRAVDSVSSIRPQMQSRPQSQQPQNSRPNNQPRADRDPAQFQKKDDRRENIREALRQQVRVRDQSRQDTSAPVEPVTIKEVASNDNSSKPPSDWLTPKVYKGSTDVAN